jgi:hypothetical protein
MGQQSCLCRAHSRSKAGALLRLLVHERITRTAMFPGVECRQQMEAQVTHGF